MKGGDHPARPRRGARPRAPAAHRRPGGDPSRRRHRSDRPGHLHPDRAGGGHPDGGQPEAEEVTNRLNGSKLRGRSGAGFPTATKWDFCRKAKGSAHYVACNADEGGPGTFKDWVLFTRVPDLVFEGMTVAAWAIGAREGLEAVA